MEQFLLQYGLLAVLCCAAIESDVTFILTGAIIHRGLLNPGLALLYCVAGALAHDLFWYWLGHSQAESIRQSSVYRRVGPVVERYAARVGIWELFFCRFVYGTRNPSIVFWGLHRFPLGKFVMVDALALTVWGGMLLFLGYSVTLGVTEIIGRVKQFEHLLLVGAVVVVLAVVTMRALARYEIRKRLPQSPEDET